MFLPGVENHEGDSGYHRLIQAARSNGQPYSQIWHLFAFKRNMTQHLERMTHELMRGPSPLSPGQRELIAALTSVQNQCPF